ncbi:MAG: aminoacyl-tRNA hydrolase [Cyanobacteria bacterium]|nr:aminoacyl-tRNA hydrolase [Cyanobacteriota bacterium]MDA1020884.1 aminoacyl-tRNA hydrolase [Cyanobacteriota bacterium]
MSIDKKTKLIIGLGNPGKNYDKTRHNIGFAILDELAFKRGLSFSKEKKFEADVAMADVIVEYRLKKPKTKSLAEKLPDPGANAEDEARLLGCKIIIAKPTTFMNNSGKAVSKLAKFYKIAAEDILVIHDDVSLDTGKLRMAFNRGAGGQHGVEDIMASIGKNFHRLKAGVGPDPGGESRADYVLSIFPKKEHETIATMLSGSIELIYQWLTELEDPQLIESLQVS